MSDRRDRDSFEDELRRALHAEVDNTERPRAANTGDLLERIHRRVARRRARRRVGAFFATAAMIAAITLVVPLVSPTPPMDQASDVPGVGSAPTHSDSPKSVAEAWKIVRPHAPNRDAANDEPSAAPPRHARLPVGVPVEADGVHVSSVSGSSSEEYWLSASATCGGGTCNVLGHADASTSMSYTRLPGDPQLPAATVRFSGDGQNGWATDGRAVFRTVDGGAEWSRLQQPAAIRVESLEAWGDQVWVVGSRGRRSVVLNERDPGELQELTTPHNLSREPDLAVALGEDAFGASLEGVEPDFAYTVDGGARWNRSQIGCDPVDISATAGAVWAFCDESTPTLVRSTDQGRTWESPEPVVDLGVSAGEPATIAAVSDDTAFVTAGSQGWVVESSSVTPATGLGDGPYVYAGFTTESVGYVVDQDGSLCRTVDGGLNWSPVDLS
jgi:photosystem II stability/assembly factor-like uncharacterized protein